MKSKAGALVLLLGLMLTLDCSSGTLSPTTGNVTLYLTDAPIDLSTVSAVNVTLSEIVLYKRHAEGDDDGIEMNMPFVSSERRIVNLLDFQNGRTTVLASVEAPAGDYRRVRMRILAAELVMDDDGDPATPEAVEPIFIPSGKVDIPVPFTISGGERLAITVDFDAALSVQVNSTNGQHPFILRPVITPVNVSSH